MQQCCHPRCLADAGLGYIREDFEAAGGPGSSSRPWTANLRGQADGRPHPDTLGSAGAVPQLTAPQLCVLFDTMHLYFSNGLVSWEMQMCRQTLHEDFPAFTLTGSNRSSHWAEPICIRRRRGGYGYAIDAQGQEGGDEDKQLTGEATAAAGEVGYVSQGTYRVREPRFPR